MKERPPDPPTRAVDTVGLATSLVQGYPTQIWVPRPPNKKRGFIPQFGIIHDRRDQANQPGIYMIPGNRPDQLGKNLQNLEVQDEDGGRRRMEVPAAFLWDFHGGPCERDGSRYRKVAESVLDLAYQNQHHGRPSMLPKELIDTNLDYIGIFDLPLEGGRRERKLGELAAMNSDLLWPADS